MKLICNTTDFADVVSACARLSSASKIIPVLENVKLVAQGDELTVTGSSGEMTLIRRMPAQVDEDGAALLPAKTLADMARKLPAGELILESAGTGIRIRCGLMRSTLSAGDAALFPEPSRADSGREIQISADVLQEAFARTKFAASQDKTRPIINGIHIRAKGRAMTVTAIDTAKLSTVSIDLDAPAEFEAVVPTAAVNEIEKFPKRSTISLRAGKASIEATSGDSILLAQRAEGEYIRFEQILARNTDIRMSIKRADMLEALERAVAVAGVTIRMTIEGNRVRLSAMSQTADYMEELDIYHDGPDLMIGFDARLLIESMKATDSDMIDMLFASAALQPVTIAPAHDDRHRMMAFPLRLKA